MNEENIHIYEFTVKIDGGARLQETRKMTARAEYLEDAQDEVLSQLLDFWNSWERLRKTLITYFMTCLVT